MKSTKDFLLTEGYNWQAQLINVDNPELVYYYNINDSSSDVVMGENGGIIQLPYQLSGTIETSGVYNFVIPEGSFYDCATGNPIGELSFEYTINVASEEPRYYLNIVDGEKIEMTEDFYTRYTAYVDLAGDTEIFVSSETGLVTTVYNSGAEDPTIKLDGEFSDSKIDGKNWLLSELRGRYQISFCTSNMTLTVLPVNFYLASNGYNNWDIANPAQFESTTEGVYTLRVALTAADGNWLTLSTYPAPVAGDWNSFKQGCYGPATNDTDYRGMAIDESVTDTTVTKTFAFNNCWILDAGEYEFFFSLLDNMMKITRVGQAGVDGIEANGGETPVYYNLQGVEVLNPENGIYIEVRGGTARKVVIR